MAKLQLKVWNILICLACIFIVFCLGYALVIYPINPIANGNFPKEAVWVFETKEKIISTPIVSNTTIIIRSSKGLYAVNYSGELLWQSDSIGGNISITIAPKVCKDVVLVPEDRSSIAAFSIENGNFLWRDYSCRYQDVNQCYNDFPVESISCLGNTTYVSRYNADLTAYDLFTGEVRWEKNLPSRTSLPLEVDESHIFLGAAQVLKVFDPLTGHLLWEKEFKGYIISLNKDEQNLYILDNLDSDTITSYNIKTGFTNWEVNLPKPEKYLMRSLSPLNSVLFFSGESLKSLSAMDGSQIWEFEEHGPFGNPVVLNNHLFVRNASNDLFELDLYSGIRIGQLKIQSNLPIIYASNRDPALAGDLLIVPFGDIRVFAYQP